MSMCEISFGIILSAVLIHVGDAIHWSPPVGALESIAFSSADTTASWMSWLSSTLAFEVPRRSIKRRTTCCLLEQKSKNALEEMRIPSLSPGLLECVGSANANQSAVSCELVSRRKRQS